MHDERETHTQTITDTDTHTNTHRNKDDWNHQFFWMFLWQFSQDSHGSSDLDPWDGGHCQPARRNLEVHAVNATHSTPETTRAHTHIYIYICVYNYIDYKQYSMAHTTGRICRLLLLSPLGWPIELPCNLQSRSIPVADSSDLFWARL